MPMSNEKLAGRLMVIWAATLVTACGAPSDDKVDTSSASATMIKWILVDACAGNDLCVGAVDAQLQGCLGNSDYRKFMDASTDEEEDLYLDKTLDQIAKCVVDENGKPFFVFGT